MLSFADFGRFLFLQGGTNIMINYSPLGYEVENNDSYIYIYTLWLFNVAMENGPFIDDVPIKMVIFHGHVK